MPVALKNKIDLISPDFFGMLNDYVDYLVFKSQNNEIAKTDIESPYGRKFGIAKTEDYWIAPDFDAPLEDFKEYM